MDEQPDTSDEQPTPARARARDLLRRTAPVLRDVNSRIEQHEALRETRDRLVDRAGEIARRADDAIGKMTAIEGTVVEGDESVPRPAAASSQRPAEGSTVPRHAAGGEREPHWTKQRLARMASAAATEAVRPHRPLVRRETKLALLLGAIAGLFVATLLRRR